MKRRIEDWFWLLHDEPERWLIGNSATGMFVFLLAAGIAPHPYSGMLTGAGLLCAAVFWLFILLGMAGWP